MCQITAVYGHVTHFYLVQYYICAILTQYKLMPWPHTTGILTHFTYVPQPYYTILADRLPKFGVFEL